MQNSVFDDPHFSKIADHYVTDEARLVERLEASANLSEADRKAISTRAKGYIEQIRAAPGNTSLIDKFLQQYGLSTEEGITLMQLAEALIRTPDSPTAHRLIRAKIAKGDWSKHFGKSPAFLVNSATAGLQISSAWIRTTGGTQASSLAARLGDRTLHRAVEHAMEMMGEHFVQGRSIEAAMEKAGRALYSFDMLGEAALTDADASRYFQSYLDAAKYIAKTSDSSAGSMQSHGISVKLSALHPRYEFGQKGDCLPALTNRLIDICHVAKDANIGVTIDAEEADRLELSLAIFDRLLAEPALADWHGLGIVVQAYQRRAIPVLKRLIEKTGESKRRIAVRLVKGAYWDMEIKRAQEMGLESYPVFTRKENSDVSYLACARLLLSAGDRLFPQFATHNAHSAAAIVEMAGGSKTYEFQRLHGMGEALHDILVAETGVNSRIYAPVGAHKDLLPYLVRRLLENGANSSFVNQIYDAEIAPSQLARDPIALALGNEPKTNPAIPSPCDLFGGERQLASGADFTQSDVGARLENIADSPASYRADNIIAGKSEEREAKDVVNPARLDKVAGQVQLAETRHVDLAVGKAKEAIGQDSMWAEDRAACLNRAADMLLSEEDRFLHFCVVEAGKTLPDAIAEIREAVDFCRYYALQAQSGRMGDRERLGVVACISPWNFPLAIFMGQVTAAFAAGNAVVAKPAEQTPLIAYEAVKLLHAAGIPETMLHLVIGGGEIGNHLIRHPDIAGVCFTGSTGIAKHIAAGLAETGRAAAPFIAETGGINAMIVDSTALLEQAVGDVVASAFQSAGQRCSACRIVCVQEEIADDFIAMLSGAMDRLVIGDPAQLSTDVGPVIDRAAHTMISDYCANMRDRFPVVGTTSMPDGLNGNFVVPMAFEVGDIADAEREIFGPVLHVVRYPSDGLDDLVEAINGLGYGLTMGLHSRIDDRVNRVAAKAHVGNLYVNRNQIGAVVGVQPFGGEGLSGTGPKAGGPHYLLGLSKPSGENASAGGPSPATDQMAVDDAELGRLLARALDAQRRWQSMDRSKPFAGLQHDDQISHIYSDLYSRYGENLHKAVVLPGPTGESNELSLHPRGVMLCFGGDHDVDLHEQIARSLVAGNAVIAAVDEQRTAEFAQFVETISAASAPDDLIQSVKMTEALALIQHPVDGLCADGALRTAVAMQAARRDGPILSVLSARSDLARYCHERTVTINTTAAGGNASLLAQISDQAV